MAKIRSGCATLLQNLTITGGNCEKVEGTTADVLLVSENHSRIEVIDFPSFPNDFHIIKETQKVICKPQAFHLAGKRTDTRGCRSIIDIYNIWFL